MLISAYKILFVSARHRYGWKDDIQFHIALEIVIDIPNMCDQEQEHRALKLKKSKLFHLKKTIRLGRLIDPQNHVTICFERPVFVV